MGALIETLKKLLSQHGRMKVVLIDDDEDDTKLVKDLLATSELSSFEVECISNAAAGLAAIQKQDGAIYLLDYRLGAVTGLDILEQVKPLMLERPIILLTGIGDRETDLAAMEAGAWDFLTKDGLTAESLERSIRYCLYRADDLEMLRSAEKAKLERDVAEAATQAKTEFLAHMSHEIRSPLTAILGFTKLALDRSCSQAERFEFLEIIKRSGDHLLEVVNDILDVSKIEEGCLELESTNFEWTVPVNDVVSILRRSAEIKGLKLDVEIEEGLRQQMAGDAHRFRQILFNLLNNAIKFTSHGFVILKVSKSSVGGCLSFDVVDSGIGMSEAEKTKIFQPFTQGNATLSRRYGGTGLGLSLSKTLAEALGGTLSLERSSSDGGSTFRLILPFSLEHIGNQLLPPNVAHCIEVEKEERIKVLVVDDSPENRLLVKHFLKSEDIDLKFACDGQSGIDAAQSEEFDVILMDIQMPVVDGYEATRRLRNSGYSRPIIALTAHALTAERDRVLSSGFSGFVSKPIQPAVLIATLRNAGQTDTSRVSGTPRENSSMLSSVL
jgi:two-component system sensor histidine kinase/response regulator